MSQRTASQKSTSKMSVISKGDAPAAADVAQIDEKLEDAPAALVMATIDEELEDTPIKVANSKKSAKEAKPKKSSKVAKDVQKHAHPKYVEMIGESIKVIKDRKGASGAAICNYIMKSFDVGDDRKQVYNQVRIGLKKGTNEGLLKRVEENGKMTNRYRVNASSSTKSPKKSAASPERKKLVAKSAASPKQMKVTKTTTASPKQMKVTKKTPASPKPTKATKKTTTSPKPTKVTKKTTASPKPMKVTKKITASPKPTKATASAKTKAEKTKSAPKTKIAKPKKTTSSN